MGVKTGYDICLLVYDSNAADYTEVGEQTGVSFNPAVDMIEVTSKGKVHKQFLPGHITETVSLNAVYVDDEDSYLALKTAFRARTLVKVMRYDNSSSSNVEWAEGYVTSMPEDFPDGGGATINVEIQLVPQSSDEIWTAA